MKRFLKALAISCITGGVILCTGASGYCQDDALIEQASDDAISRAVSSLVKSAKTAAVERIAVYPLEKAKAGYDNETTDLLTIALSKTKYRVILRDELLKVMSEHGFVLGKVDLFNSETVKKLGGFLGVDAIIYGTVKQAETDVSGGKVRLNLKMADVTTGELVWGEAVSGFAARAEDNSPQAQKKPSFIETASFYAGKIVMNPRMLLFILIVVAAVFILIVLIRKGSALKAAIENLIPGYDYTKAENRLKTDRAVRTMVIGELSKAIATLREAGDVAYGDKNTEVAARLKELAGTVDALRLDVDNAPYGTCRFFKESGLPSEAFGRMADFDRALHSMSREIALIAKELHEDSSARRMADVPSKVSDLQKKASQLKVKFADRKDYLAGMA